MDIDSNSNYGHVAGDAAASSGHWFPALRPDTSQDEAEDTLPAAQWSNAQPNPDGESINHIPKSAEITSTPSKVGTAVNGLHHDSKSQDGIRQPSTGVRPPESQHSEIAGHGREIPVAADDDDHDEQLDPAWGIKRQETSLILDQVRRSTTFPDFDTADDAPSQLNQASEDVPVGNGDTRLDITNVEEEGVSGTYTSDWVQDEQDDPESEAPWPQPQAQEAHPADEATQRFDEGVPLIHNHEATMDKAADAAEPDVHLPADPFSPLEEDDEASFFAQINTSVHAPARPALDRKSTSQVLDSMNFTTDAGPDSPAAQFPPTDTQLESSISQRSGSEDVDAMWAAVLNDGDLLDEDADDLLSDSDGGAPSSYMASYRPSPAPDHVRPTSQSTLGHAGISQPGLAPMGSFPNNLREKLVASQAAQSFADQSKDGYKSPYDLPLEISKPRRKLHAPQPIQVAKSVAPPPRSSSLIDKPLQPPFTSNDPMTSTSVPGPLPPPPRSVPTAPASKQHTASRSGSSSFFEELPVASRSRPATGTGRFTPQQTMTSPPQQLPPQSPPQNNQFASQQHQSPPSISDPYAQYQLQPPERVDPYAHVPLPAPPATVTTSQAAPSTRYSPAPGAGTLGPRPAPSPRYSPAPPPQPSAAQSANRYASQPVPNPPAPHAPLIRHVSQSGPMGAPVANILQYQPRTSSPLASFHKSSVEGVIPPLPSDPGQISRPGLVSPPLTQPPIVHQQTSYFPEQPTVASPPKRGELDRAIAPPRRSQTQSPTKLQQQSSFALPQNDDIGRPASAHGHSTAARSFAQPTSAPAYRPNLQSRNTVPELEFVVPGDDSQFDPLQRWKGAPLFKFGFGGTIISTFPIHVPRYSAGSARPQIKAAPGEISVRNAKSVLSHSDLLASFPGPLRSKSKKKEVAAWMSAFIADLETQAPDFVMGTSQPDPRQRHQEKILLWKIVRALVEHDGTLDGNGEALKAINMILSPEIHSLDESSATKYRADEQFSGIYRPAGANTKPDSVDPMAVETLRKRLLVGDRQAAVIHAMDSRLWSHALIIASTMDRRMWNQVVREFVRQEVKTVGENSEPLSALYEIFGGNVEDSIDQLVPPSARAGLQMVSKVDNVGPTRNALDGLNRWKETLSLILNNRSHGDHQALTVLGKLLQDYKRIEAAHICYMFSRNSSRPMIFGGADDETAPIVLLGADHKSNSLDFGHDQQSILLTEIYEFATGVLASVPAPAMPHFAIYKLQRATSLAEAGLKLEAQAYCDALAAVFKSSSKISPYHHALFLSNLEELSNRLKQTPIQGSSSWIAKPNLEKVSGSVWNKFTNFVAGDESDTESKGSGKDPAEIGPFAKVASTPSMSRRGSQAEVYGSYPVATAPVVPNTVAGSRYAPNGMQSARSSSELTRGRPSLDSQRSPPPTSHSQGNRPYEPVNMFHQGSLSQPNNAYQSIGAISPPRRPPQSPATSSYMPNDLLQSAPQLTNTNHNASAAVLPAEISPARSFGYQADVSPSQQSVQDHQHALGGYQPSHPSMEPFGQPAFGGYNPLGNGPAPNPDQPDEQSNSYEAPSQSYGYEPPTSDYVPYVPEPDSPDEKPKAKKKSFMDDDEDDYHPQTRAQHPTSAPRQSTDGDVAAKKRANDAAADAAFRAAAEADAAAEKEKKESRRTSSSWFGGWLGGRKSESLDAGSAPSKAADNKQVHRVHLGESKMKLYYDKELGKWVNPDNPDAHKKTATPPPPRMSGTPAPPSGPSPLGPPSDMGPPSGPVSRVGTPAGSGLPPLGRLVAGNSGPPSAAGTPPLPQPPTPGIALPAPLSRPGTAMSNASSIDDLIGPATGRKPGGKGPKKGKGRYVDVMAQS